MVKAMTLDPADQARRRRRARVTQQEIAERLQISLGAVSKYETGADDLPWELTPEDYERAINDAIRDKGK